MPGIYKYSMEIESNVKKLLLDTKELQDRMDTLEGKEYKINLNIDEKKLGNVISNLEKMLDSLGKGTGDFKQFETLSKDLAKVTSELSGFTKAFGKIDNSGTKSLLDMVQNIDKSLNNLSSHVTDVAKNLGNIGKDSGASSAVAQIENITKANEEAIKSTEKLAEARKKINDNISVSTKGTSFTSNTSALQQEEKQIQKNINSLNKLLALKSDVKNVKKSSYSGKGNLDYVGIYHSQEEAVSKDLATKSNKLNASLNLILNEDKDAVQELESEVTKLKTSLKSVQDLTKRISKNSSINDLTKEQDVTERLKGYASAYQAIDTRLGELNNEYSLSNKQLEEYITLQAKAEKIMNEVASNEFGGVRGYGDVTSKAQLKMLVEESFAKRLGYDSQDVYDGLFKNISDANYDSKHISLFGDNGKKRSLKEVSAQILDYKSSASSLSGVFGANEDIERLNTLNSILNYIKTNEKEIANTDFTAQINRLTAMLENTSGLTFLEEELQELKSYQERLDSVKNTSIDSASTSSISEQNKVQEELKETQIQAEETKSSLNDLSNVKGLKHYTDEVFDKFDNNMFGSGIGENRLGEAAYFFDEKNSGDWSDIGEYSKYLTTWSANQVKLFDQTIGFTEEQINQIIKEFYSDVDEDIQEDYKFDLKNIMDEDLYEFKSKFGIELQDVMKSLGYDALKTNSGEYAFYNTDKLVREVQVYDQEANKIIDINNKVAESIKETSSDQTKDAFPDKDVSTSVESATNSIKEENNVLEQNTQKVKENTQAKEQNTNVNLNKYDKRLDSYNGKVDKYQATIDRFNDGGWTSDTYLKNVQAVRDAIKQYATLLDNIKTNQNGIASDKDIQNLDKYEKKIKDTIATVTNMSAAEKGYNFVSGQKELDKIHKILDENTRMSSSAKAKIKSYYKEIESGNPSMSLDKIHGEIMKIVNAEKEAGRAGKSMWSAIKEKAWYGAASAIGTYFGVNDIFRYGKEIADIVIQLDTATTELRKVSDATDQRLVTNFKNSAKTAKQLGSTISDVISATADWSRMGYDIDQAEELARVSTLYKNVGDGIDIETANNSLISTLQGFQLDASQAESIIDKFNEVANNYAIDSAGIGEALQRSAASFNAANTDLSKSIALITATNEVVQDPDSVGTLWKTMSARIRGAETELSELNEETDEYTKTTSKLRDLIKSLTGFDIMADEDTFKDIYDIILGIGKEWNNLTDAEQSSLGEALAGKRNANALYAVLGNLDTLQSAYKTAENSAGSAQREQENYQKSIQYSIDQTKAKLEELSADFLSSDFLKGAIDAGGKLINILDNIVKSGNAIPAVATAIAAAFSFKNVGLDKNVLNSRPHTISYMV